MQRYHYWVWLIEYVKLTVTLLPGLDGSGDTESPEIPKLVLACASPITTIGENNRARKVDVSFLIVMLPLVCNAK